MVDEITATMVVGSGITLPKDFPCVLSFGDVEITLLADGSYEGDVPVSEEALGKSQGLGVFAPIFWLILREMKRGP